MAGRQRTLKRAIDLRDLSFISAEQLLSCGLEFCQQVRRRATLARNSQTPIVCGQCGWAVYLTKNGLTKEYLWSHFAGAPEGCEWFTGRRLTPDQVGAMQFGGVQESPLHFRLKNLIGELLELDPSADQVVVDARLNGRAGYRKPDVRACYDGRPIALEIQLSSTQLPIILEREMFYLGEGRSLLWIGWQPSLTAKSDVPQALLDILTAHNDNLFSVDEESIRISRENRKLTLRVHWWEANRCINKLVTLDDLTYPESGLPFAVERPAPWHETFKRKWLSVTTPDGSDWRDRKYLYAELIEALQLGVTDTELSFDFEIESLLCLLLSLERNIIVGSRQRNITEVLHTFLTTNRRKPMAEIVLHAVNMSGHASLLQRPKTLDLVSRARAVRQVDCHSVEARIARSLFPQWVASAPRASL